MKTNPYMRTFWEDEIVDPVAGEVIEEGTRFTAERANNIEDGIYNAYQWLMTFYDAIQKMQVQLDMMGRAPVNNGSFFDTIEGDTKALTRDLDKATAQAALSAGATTISLDSAPFAIGEFVAVYDGSNHEVVEVRSITGSTITVTALSNAYKKGASVARTNAVVSNNKLIPGTWGTYTVTVQEVV